MKKYSLIVFLFFGMLTLSACGSSSSEVTADEVITAFKDAGLEAENPTDLDKVNLVIQEKKGKES